MPFGNAKAYVSENQRYLADCLLDGYCDIAVPNYSLFARHNLCRLSDANNGGIMDVLRGLFAYPGREKLDKRQVQTLTCKVDVSKDLSIQSLFADPEFQRLNGCSVS